MAFKFSSVFSMSNVLTVLLVTPKLTADPFSASQITTSPVLAKFKTPLLSVSSALKLISPVP